MRKIIREDFYAGGSVKWSPKNQCWSQSCMPFIYVSEGVNSYMNLFLDNTKIMKQITNIDRCWELQEDDKSLRRNQN